MSDGMQMEVKLAGLKKTFGRLAGGGSLFEVVYTNNSPNDGFIAMTPDYPGVIVPINMQSCPAGKIIALRDSFLCSTVGLGEVTTDVGAGFNPASSVGGVCCSGVDFIVQVCGCTVIRTLGITYTSLTWWSLNRPCRMGNGRSLWRWERCCKRYAFRAPIVIQKL